MSLAFRLPEQCKIVEGLNPATDAAGRTGAYITLKNFHKVYIVCHVQQGNATPVAWSVNQAQDLSGTGAKAIPAVPIWSNEDTSLTDTLVLQASAASYTNTATLKNKQVVFEIDPSYLDVANGFRTIAIVTGASNAANITEAQYYGIADRFAQATPPSATAAV